MASTRQLTRAKKGVIVALLAACIGGAGAGPGGSVAMAETSEELAFLFAYPFRGDSSITARMQAHGLYLAKGSGDPRPLVARPAGVDAGQFMDEELGFLTPKPKDFAWSPDGSRIAFVGERLPVAGTADLYVMDADGTDLRNLTRRHDAGVQRATFEMYPTWSPDGTKIAFVRRVEGATADDFRQKIATINSDGTGLSILPVQGIIQNDHPSYAVRGTAWSPDGNTIAYSARQDMDGNGYAESSGIFFVAAGGGAPTYEIPGGREPAWSPDGSRIAYELLAELWVKDLTTQETKGLVVYGTDGTDWVEVEAPSWSPEGTKIAFNGLVERSGGLVDRDIFSVNADGTGFSRLYGRSGTEEHAPQWRPCAATCALSVTRTPSWGWPTLSSKTHFDGTSVVRVGAASVPDLAGKRVGIKAFTKRDGRWVRIGRVTSTMESRSFGYSTAPMVRLKRQRVTSCKVTVTFEGSTRFRPFRNTQIFGYC